MRPLTRDAHLMNNDRCSGRRMLWAGINYTSFRICFHSFALLMFPVVVIKLENDFKSKVKWSANRKKKLAEEILNNIPRRASRILWWPKSWQHLAGRQWIRCFQILMVDVQLGHSIRSRSNQINFGFNSLEDANTHTHTRAALNKISDGKWKLNFSSSAVRIAND